MLPLLVVLLILIAIGIVDWGGEKRYGGAKRYSGDGKKFFVFESCMIPDKCLTGLFPGYEKIPLSKAIALSESSTDMKRLSESDYLIDFFYQDTGFRDKSFSIPARVKCWLICPFWDKIILHRLLKETDIICPTLIIGEDPVPDKGVWIFRSNLGHSGSGNIAVDCSDQEAVKEIIKKLSQMSAKHRTSHVMASRYITNPGLWKGRKFHYRVLVLCVVTKSDKKIFTLSPILMALSKKKYISSDYQNQDYHDTHLRYGQLVTKRPHHDLIPMITKAYTALLPYIDKYPESAVGYMYHGVDAMVDLDSDQCKLIETNGYPSVDRYKDKIKCIVAKEMINIALHNKGYLDATKGLMELQSIPAPNSPTEVVITKPLMIINQSIK